jgi:LacI family transcriptional regulator
MMDRRVTIKDIARELGTTVSTVSRALNHAPGIGEEMRRKILAKAGEMGYEPNLFARQLRQGGSKTIGLIVPRINRFFFSSVIHGVESVANERGYSVIICQSNEDRLREEENIRTLLSQRVAGILMSLSKETERAGMHLEILRRKLPFVMFDRVFRKLDGNRVVNDNYAAAYQVTRHLMEQGYRKLVHLAGPPTINIYLDRREGFLSAAREGGSRVRSRIVENVLTKERGQEETEKMLNRGESFDAILAASDFSALGSMLTLRDHGISVPDETGVAGFANEPFTELLEITSVDQKSSEVGRSAARLLFEGIESTGESSFKEIVIHPEVIIRKSTLKSGQHEIQREVRSSSGGL